MSVDQPFQSKAVIVTGAASGIGQALAQAYGAAGANVVLADVNEQNGEKNAATIRSGGGHAAFVRADMRQEADVIRLMNETVSTFGAIHVLINNAGVSRFQPLYDLSTAEWDDIVSIHLRGTFLCSREAARRMRGHGGDRAIVNIASTRALMSEPGSEAYAAAKGGIVAMTHALALSLGPDRIRVNCVSPGWIRTTSYESLRDIDHAQHPAGRVGKVEDIVRACFYLTDPSNDFVTGINLVVDGGMTRKMIYEPEP
jgi:NAD(P)-dependent dehydrogenase (short-subunit alcohol dehydrogenase family)